MVIVLPYRSSRSCCHILGEPIVGFVLALQNQILLSLGGMAWRNLSCIKAWLLYSKLWGSVYHTGFILWSWYLVGDYLPSSSNYDVMLDHAHIRFLSEEKNCCWKRLQNLEQFPLVLGPLLLLQPRATTVVTRSHGGSRNSYLWGKYKSLCLIDSKN